MNLQQLSLSEAITNESLEINSETVNPRTIRKYKSANFETQSISNSDRLIFYLALILALVSSANIFRTKYCIEKVFDVNSFAQLESVNLLTFADLDITFDVFSVYLTIIRNGLYLQHNDILIHNLTISFDELTTTPNDLLHEAFETRAYFPLNSKISRPIFLMRGYDQHISRILFQDFITADWRGVTQIEMKIFGYVGIISQMKWITFGIAVGAILSIIENYYEAKNDKNLLFSNYEYFLIGGIILALNPLRLISSDFDVLQIYIVCSLLFKFIFKTFQLIYIFRLSFHQTENPKIIMFVVVSLCTLMELLTNNQANIKYVRFDINPTHFSTISAACDVVYMTLLIAFVLKGQINPFNVSSLVLFIIMFILIGFISIFAKLSYLFLPWQFNFFGNYILTNFELLFALFLATLPPFKRDVRSVIGAIKSSNFDQNEQ